MIACGCVAGDSGPAHTPDGAIAPRIHDASMGDAQSPECQGEGYTMHAACDDPPAAQCIDDTTWGSQDSLGRCVAMRCEYTPQPRVCFGGCDADGCRLCPGGEVVEHGDVFREGVLHWPERTCWPRESLGDPNHLPRLAGAPDGSVSAAPAVCPDADDLEWGSIAGEACVDQPACPALLDSPEGQCCYVTFRVCGV